MSKFFYGVAIALFLVSTHSFGQETNDSSCEIIYLCETKLYVSVYAKTAKLKVQDKTSFIFKIKGSEVRFEPKTGKGVLGDGSLPLKLGPGDSCKSKKADLKVFPDWGNAMRAENAFTRIIMDKDKLLLGNYNREYRVDTFIADCELVE